MIKRIILFLFSFLIILIVAGLNDYLSELWDTERALSLFILALSFLVIALVLAMGHRIVFNRYVKIFISIFIIYLILASISTIFNPANDDLGWGFRYYLPSLVIYFTGLMGFTYWSRRGSLNSMINVFRISLLLNTFTVILSYLLSVDFFIIKEDRASGINLNANSAGYIAVLALAFELFYLSKSKGRWNGIMIPLILLGVFATFSKSAYLMALMVIALYGLYAIRSTGRFRKLGGLLRVIVVLTAVVYLFGDMSSLTSLQLDRIKQFTSLISGEITSESTTNRSDLAVIGWKKILDTPVMGQGFQTMSKLGPSIGGVHNQYLLLWGEAGIFAMMAFVYLLVMYFRWSWELPAEYGFLIRAILLTIAFYSLTNHNMYAFKSLMLTLAFMAVLFNYFRNVRNFRPAGPKP